MTEKRYRQMRAFAGLLVGAIVSVAVIKNSYLLAAAGVITGMIFLSLVRSKAKTITDERMESVKEKAALLTYSIFAPTLGIGAFIMLFPTLSHLTVFAKGDFVFLDSLGMIFAYLTLFMMTIYAISYYYLNRKYGGK